MEPVATEVLDGLLEGLVLHAIEQEPSHGYGILKDLEGAIGTEPSKNRVYRVLREMEEADLLDSEEVTEASRTRQVYSLTEAGAQRLQGYRELPAPFKTWLSGLFDIDGAGAPEREVAPETEPAAVDREEGWVQARLDELPAETSVQARHAEFSLERSPGQARWRFEVERHEPGDYEGSGSCPLTFVYLAIQRLLYEADQPR